MASARGPNRPRPGDGRVRQAPRLTVSPSEPRVLSQRELNRATLARQLLLSRVRLPPLLAVERLAGLQGQWAPSPYVGLWSRLEGFRRGALERPLMERRIVKALMMRGTLHLVSMADYLLFTAALHGGGASPVNPAAMAFAERVAGQVRAFCGDRAVTRTELFEWLERERAADMDGQPPWMSWYAIRVRAHVVHSPSSAMWRSPNSPTFEALPHVVLPDPMPARVELIRRYLRAFGPATRADIADWTGLRVRDFAPALERLEPLRRFRNEAGRELLDVRRAPLPSADTPAPVRFLPKWDSVLLAHADRTRVLPEEYRQAMIATNGDVAQSFLVDGMVAGMWSVAKGRVSVRPFEPLPPDTRRDLEEEAALLDAFMA